MFEWFTDRARRVVVLAQEEARLLNHDYVGTEHLLLGLVREGEGVATRVLIRLGADLPRVRQQVVQLLSGSAGGPEAAAGTPLVPMPMPPPEELREAGEQLAEVRRQKEAAIEAQDFERAAALRDAEEELLAGLAEREREGTAGVDLAAVLHEVRRLHGEVERLRGEVQGLRELLRRHGIEPDGGTTQTA
jgi:Clp amino terminal domain, pathogenicity island component/UvrB/uvrC motif